jgi:SAM-dependent methyltransferase
VRQLEIGPGWERLPKFETLNLVKNQFTDHVGDCRRPPFGNDTFDVVYSSHCIEHVEWYEVEDTIREWVRILKPGGLLEVHTVNGYLMMKAMIEYEETGATTLKAGKWKDELHKYDPYKWAAGRILNYARNGEKGTSWMHRAILTPRYLTRCFEIAGLGNIEPVAEPRGSKKHAAINMGFKGTKC